MRRRLDLVLFLSGGLLRGSEIDQIGAGSVVCEGEGGGDAGLCLGAELDGGDGDEEVGRDCEHHEDLKGRGEVDGLHGPLHALEVLPPIEPPQCFIGRVPEGDDEAVARLGRGGAEIDDLVLVLFGQRFGTCGLAAIHVSGVPGHSILDQDPEGQRHLFAADHFIHSIMSPLS